jgi:hypothetical protein
MKLSKLIGLLLSIKREHGDVDCYTNGEYGIGECRAITESHITAASACLIFDADAAGIEDDSDIILHIGGG